MISQELETLRQQKPQYLELQLRWNTYQTSQRTQQPMEIQDELYESYQQLRCKLDLTILYFHQRLNQLESNHIRTLKRLEMKQQFQNNKKQQLITSEEKEVQNYQQSQKQTNQQEQLNYDSQQEEKIISQDQLNTEIKIPFLIEEKEVQNQQNQSNLPQDQQFIIDQQSKNQIKEISEIIKIPQSDHIEDQVLITTNQKEQLRHQLNHLDKQLKTPEQMTIMQYQYYKQQEQNQEQQNNTYFPLLIFPLIQQSKNQLNQSIFQKKKRKKLVIIIKMSNAIASKDAQLCTQEILSNQLIKHRSPILIKKKLRNKQKLQKAMSELNDNIYQIIIPNDSTYVQIKQQTISLFPQYSSFLDQLTTLSSCKMFIEINHNNFMIEKLNSTSIQDYQENITALMSQFIYFQFEKQMTPISPQFFCELWELIINVITNQTSNFKQLIRQIQHFVIKSYIFHQVDNETYKTLTTGVSQSDTQALILLFYRDQQQTDQQYLLELQKLSLSLKQESTSRNWFGQQQSNTSSNNQNQIRKWTSSFILESLESISYQDNPDLIETRQLLFLKKALICIQQFLKLSQYTIQQFLRIGILRTTYVDSQQFIQTQLLQWDQQNTQPYQFPQQDQFADLIAKDFEYFTKEFSPVLQKVGQEFYNNAKQDLNNTMTIAQRPSKIIRYVQSQEQQLMKQDYESSALSPYASQNNQLCNAFFGKLNQIYDDIIDIKDSQAYQIQLTESVNNNLLQVIQHLANQKLLQNQLTFLKDENYHLKISLQMHNDDNIIDTISNKQQQMIAKQNNILQIFNNNEQSLETYRTTMMNYLENFINSILTTGLDSSKHSIMKILDQERTDIEQIEKYILSHQQILEKTKFKLTTQDISRQLTEINNYFDRIPQEWLTIQRTLKEKIQSIQLSTDFFDTTIKEQSLILKSQYKSLINEIISPIPHVKQEKLYQHSINVFQSVTDQIIASLNIPQNKDAITKHLKKLQKNISNSDSYANIQDFFERIMKLKVPDQLPIIQKKLINQKQLIINSNQQ